MWVAMPESAAKVMSMCKDYERHIRDHIYAKLMHTLELGMPGDEPPDQLTTFASTTWLL